MINAYPVLLYDDLVPGVKFNSRCRAMRSMKSCSEWGASDPAQPPPYQVAVVELTEGPRLLAGITGDPVRIGDQVTVTWRERPDAPPIPYFMRTTVQ